MAKGRRGRKRQNQVGVEELRQRLRKRTYASGEVVYWLDLRGPKWGNIGRLVVRRPRCDGWPHRGPTATLKKTAEAWVGDEDYVEFVSRRRRLAKEGPGVMTVKEALDDYIEHLRETLGEKHNTVRNRSSSLVRHLKPLYDRVLASLDEDVVQEWLEGVRVTGTDGRPTVPAKNTRHALLRGLYALWSHHMAPEEAPFHGVSLGPDEKRVSIKRDIEAGQDLSRWVTGGAYETHELERLVTAARWYDEYVILSSPPLRATITDFSAEAIALMVGTSSRLMEAARLQWHHLYDEDRIILVPGTKTGAALRAQPVQTALRPWLTHIRQKFEDLYGREPEKNDYLIQTDPRQPRRMPAGRSLGEKVATIQDVAGLKRPRKATHILRATFITMGDHQGIPRDRLKRYIGHAGKDGESGREVTDDYVSQIRSMVEPEDRRIMDCLPSPERVAELVEDFEPTVWPRRGAGAPTGDQS